MNDGTALVDQRSPGVVDPVAVVAVIGQARLGMIGDMFGDPVDAREGINPRIVDGRLADVART